MSNKGLVGPLFFSMSIQDIGQAQPFLSQPLLDLMFWRCNLAFGWPVLLWSDFGVEYDETFKDELAHYPSGLVPFRAHSFCTPLYIHHFFTSKLFVVPQLFKFLILKSLSDSETVYVIGLTTYNADASTEDTESENWMKHDNIQHQVIDYAWCVWVTIHIYLFFLPLWFIGLTHTQWHSSKHLY